MRITRRHLLLSATAALTGAATGIGLPSFGLPRSAWTDQAIAEWVLDHELHAVRGKSERWWLRLHEPSAVQWSPGKLAIFGVSQRERMRLTNEFGATACATSPDGRAWAIVANARLSAGLQRELLEHSPPHSRQVHVVAQKSILKAEAAEAVI